jgi:hypothetical protein
MLGCSWDELLTDEDLMPEIDDGGAAGTILDAALPSDDESDDEDFGSDASESEPPPKAKRGHLRTCPCARERGVAADCGNWLA